MRASRECIVGVLVAGLLAIGACKKEAGTAGAGGEDAHAHSHEKHDHGKDGHDHGHGHDHGEKHDLGSVTIGSFVVHVARYGNLEAGREIDVDVRAEGATRPTAVRVWIGNEDGTGALKALAERESDHFHAHVEVPEPFTPAARLWVEIESPEGRQVGSLPLMNEPEAEGDQPD